MRIDKWLWAARFFKTRALAQTAIAAGKVRLHGERVKAAKEIAIGDELLVRIGAYDWLITVARLSTQRGPATAAAALYHESEDSRTRRLALIEQRKALGGAWGERKGRPTKRERRQIVRFSRGQD